jgi:predicted AlkP superfamily phosphohydrolase/phosphomutase/tetratricopeptide (TPR) repeat protein
VRRLLLIGWDAADWQHIDPLLAAGHLPALAALTKRGVRGNLATLQPMVSPMLWTSIATGMTADRHGVLGFAEPDAPRGGARPWSSLTRRCKAVWNILHQQGMRCSVVNWWASHPAEPLRGTVVSNAFANVRKTPEGASSAPAGCIHPPEAAAHLARMKLFPAELGEEHLLPFVPRAGEVDQSTDHSLAVIAGLVAEMATTQGLITEILENEEWDFAAVYFDGIDHFCHSFMPFHPPRMPHVPERSFELYRDVVAGAYRFHDMMLERLVDLAGPDAAVLLCSDHGFHSGAGRPMVSPNDPAGPTLWHRDMGVFVLAGPGIREGEQVCGASLLDVTPTILGYFGLPSGADMPGRPLLEVFAGPEEDRRIASWEDVSGADGRHAPGTPYPDPPADGRDALREQFEALGYLEPAGDSSLAEQSDAAAYEARYNLAQVMLSGGNEESAVEILEALVADRPWESRCIHQLANAYARGGWHRQCVELLQRAYPESDPALPPAVVLLILARACQGLGDLNGARFYASRAFANMPSLAGAWTELGSIMLAAKEDAAALTAFRHALSLDSAFAAAWDGLAAWHLRRRENAEALDAALEATRHIAQLSGAHFTMGVALARMGQFAEARRAFGRVTQMRPRDPAAWRWLAALPDPDSPAQSGDFLAAACRQESHRLVREWSMRREERRRRASQLRPLPVLPPPAERQRILAARRPMPAPDIPDASQQRKVFTVVSGLPRSGTSLMMQMLAAGGLPPQTDHLRQADPDNPQGYWEWERIKELPRDATVLDEPGLDGRAVKIVAPLLRHLPVHHRYRVIFLLRPAADVARSQQRMLERRGAAGMPGGPGAAAHLLQQHASETLAFLRSRPQTFDVLTIDYPDILADPAAAARRLCDFLPPQMLPSPEAMAGVVRSAQDGASP